MKNEKDLCEIQCIHEEHVQKAREQMIKEDVLIELAEFFKVFGDSTRMRIINILQDRELCVCDIAAALQANQSAISHQLRILRDKRLVKYRREGKSVYYSLDDAHVENIFKEGLEHIKHR